MAIPQAELDEKGTLRILEVNNHEGPAVYITLMTSTLNRKLGHITAGGKTAFTSAIPTPSVLTPEEEVKRAQWYADCL